MSAPPKPWESAGTNFRSSPNLGVPGGLHSTSVVGQTPFSQPVVRRVNRIPEPSRAAPPVPARPSGTAYRSVHRPVGYGGVYGMGSYGTGYGGMGSYGGYGSGYGGYGSYGASGYGSYGSPMYGHGGYGMNRFPPQHGMNSLESRFIQMAEENSRPAFESIESLVQAFGSVSFMMESTFHAMYSSFRAVLGVAENFGRLRSLFGQVFQTFALLRFFQWMYRKLLYYLGIRRENPGEAVWKQAAGQLDPKTRRTFWPVVMFLGLVCGGPFLVWRLLRSLNIGPAVTSESTGTASASLQAWFDPNKATTLSLAIALYDFGAATDSELSVRRGQKVWLAPQQLQPPSSDWLLVTQNWKQSGLVPATYVHVIEHRKVSVRPRPKQELVKPAVDALNGELVPEVSDQLDPIFLNANQNSTHPQAADYLQPRTVPVTTVDAPTNRESVRDDEPSFLETQQTPSSLSGLAETVNSQATPIWPVTNSLNTDVQPRVTPLPQSVQATSKLSESNVISSELKPKDADKQSENNS